MDSQVRRTPSRGSEGTTPDTEVGEPWDPVKHPGVKAGETRILGRVNVNTAPAFVLAQLPWMQYGETPGSPAEGESHRQVPGAIAKMRPHSRSRHRP